MRLPHCLGHGDKEPTGDSDERCPACGRDLEVVREIFERVQRPNLGRELAELHRSWALAEDEFANAKRKLLT